MPPAIPTATYRIQLTPKFGFDDAAAVVPYLKGLGVSHLYASPFLKARSGTTHGYDIIDHASFNPELGGESGFLRMSDALAKHNMGLILDFVPNHMAVHGSDNAWWLDVLEWGPRSPYAKFFDIDWDIAAGPPRLLLPILGRSYGEVLEAGEIELRYDASEGSFSAWYFEHRLPIGPNRYSEILQKVVDTTSASDQLAGQRLIELASRYRGPRNPSRDKAMAFRHEIVAVAGGRELIEQGLSSYHPKSGPAAATALHHLLERQHYRPAHWRLAQSDINYRRFFDINSLAGLQVEDPEVFRAIHPLVLRLIAEGRLQGLRFDHIDGLRDPHQYLGRIQRRMQEQQKAGLYIVVEKILGSNEILPRWPGVAGTTGYEWLNVISRVLVEDDGLATLDRVWRETTGDDRSFDAILRKSKQLVLSTILSSEFTVLARLLARIAIGHYSTRDYTADRLRDALELFVLNFPVYRTYVTASGASAADCATITVAIEAARKEWVGPGAEILAFLRDALTLDLVAPGRARHSVTRVRRFAFKVQQFTGPMMAKSLEDTAFYRYHRLLALNEVGGDPTSGALSVDDFHARTTARSASFPHGLTATATHDTKRGEDARARLLALSELADDWESLLARWRNDNRLLMQQLPEPRPTMAHQYMIYQSLLGALPLSGIDEDFITRSVNCVIKAAREGKEQTSWYTPNENYENNLEQFVRALLGQNRSVAFMTTFGAFAQRCALLGALNSLTQLTLKMTLPGIPDLYQGCEHWDLAFVDPDNRRPVDYALRQRDLRLINDQPDWASLANDWRSGHVKLALTHALLALRVRLRDVFIQGDYRPIEVTGPDRNEIIAFTRTRRDNAVVVVTGRFFARATSKGHRWPKRTDWNADVQLRGPDAFENILTGEKLRTTEDSGVPIISLFHSLPVAVLQAT